MKKKRLAVLVLQFVLLAAVMGGVFMYTQTEIAPTEVFAFRSDLVAGERIQANSLAVIEIPRSAVTEKFIRNPEDIVGKLVTTNVTRGQYVMADLVEDEEVINPLIGMDLSRMRKVSFPVEMPTALAGKIRAGDTVDLVYVGIGNNMEFNEPFIYSTIFMQDVIVWSASTGEGFEYTPRRSPNMDDVGMTTVPGAEGSGMEGAVDGDLEIITVVVTGPQAEEIIARSTSGQIQVLGRFRGASQASSTGFVINHYEEVYTGNANPERN